MSRTLNLAEGLLSQARNRQTFGRCRDAVAILSKLLRQRELPPGVAEETHARLGELQLQRKKYAQARRHLLIALRYDGENAHYHRLLGRALAENEAHWDRAATHQRRAVELDPEDVGGLTSLGLLCIKQGRADEGVDFLKRAVELQPSDPELLARLVKGLRLSGRADEAEKELRAALFRNGRDLRFRQLWQDHQFRQLRRRQLRAQKLRQGYVDEGPVLLPFPAPAAATQPTEVRADAASMPVPRFPRLHRSHEQRHVQ